MLSLHSDRPTDEFPACFCLHRLQLSAVWKRVRALAESARDLEAGTGLVGSRGTTARDNSSLSSELFAKENKALGWPNYEREARCLDDK